MAKKFVSEGEKQPKASTLKPKARQLVAAQDWELLVDLKERLSLVITTTGLRSDLALEASFFRRGRRGQ